MAGWQRTEEGEMQLPPDNVTLYWDKFISSASHTKLDNEACSLNTLGNQLSRWLPGNSIYGVFSSAACLVALPGKGPSRWGFNENAPLRIVIVSPLKIVSQ